MNYTSPRDTEYHKHNKDANKCVPDMDCYLPPNFLIRSCLAS